jgi:hypothetical protein
LRRAGSAHRVAELDREETTVDDPRDSVPDELENRLDGLSATLTDDDVRTTTSRSETRATADADAGDDADSTDAGDDADSTDADSDDMDADADDA